ncbi:MAG: sigma-70 family RNA polymerase sigma factor [Bacteroidales bacterium]
MEINPEIARRDRELIERCRRNDRKAQVELYSRYYKAMYNTSLRILGKPDVAEDAMQEAFIKAFRSLGAFEGRSGFGHWLKQIVIRTSIDILRKNRMILEPLEEWKIPPEEDSGPQEEEISARAEQVREVIARMPEGYRLVLSLHLLEGYDHEEIGQILGIGNSSSRSQYARARKRLIDELKKLTRNEKD